ncbi:MAG: GDYXXLXY domain-containing protein [Rhodospirillales bacterium]|nr:GDYXXLXY domain-containing protein [Alphaproteobacteria bacterium]MCB9986655.1 GDYXXLXY domain-containing protein [Rhodospirillales bacterium]USO06817.1 MAG: GDYXXLXY domain-containing protein [Rhodospirillales bacterium]
MTTPSTPRPTLWVYLAALLLPFAVLGGMTGWYVYQDAHARTYTVAIQGYDPRDIVYGEYINLRLKWDDPTSEKPARDDLPADANMYLPEGNAQDLETMLRDPALHFTAAVQLRGTRASVRALNVDGRPWQAALTDWRRARTENQSVQTPSR